MAQEAGHRLTKKEFLQSQLFCIRNHPEHAHHQGNLPRFSFCLTASVIFPHPPQFLATIYYPARHIFPGDMPRTRGTGLPAVRHVLREMGVGPGKGITEDSRALD